MVKNPCPCCGGDLDGNEEWEKRNGMKLFVVWRRAKGDTFKAIANALGIKAPNARAAFMKMHEKYRATKQWRDAGLR